MSVRLTTADGRSRKLNAWNWGVMHLLVEEGGLFDEEVWGPARHGLGELDAAQCAALAGFLREQVLPRLKPGERIFMNGSVTDVPDDGTFFRAEDELWKNYSLHHDVVVDVIALLDGADGLRFS
jgi:hypothetical protein